MLTSAQNRKSELTPLDSSIDLAQLDGIEVTFLEFNHGIKSKKTGRYAGMLSGVAIAAMLVSGAPAIAAEQLLFWNIIAAQGMQVAMKAPTLSGWIQLFSPASGPAQ